jgi:hypothetical protein
MKMQLRKPEIVKLIFSKLQYKHTFTVERNLALSSCMIYISYLARHVNTANCLSIALNFIKSLSLDIYIYTYIYIYRERERERDFCKRQTYHHYCWVTILISYVIGHEGAGTVLLQSKLSVLRILTIFLCGYVKRSLLYKGYSLQLIFVRFIRGRWRKSDLNTRTR